MDKFRKYYFLVKTLQAFSGAKDRCENKNNNSYIRYCSRGIKCLLTLEQVRELFKRDNAFEMNKPSLDRIDSDGHYSLENCRFIENKENSLRATRKPVIQYDLGYNFIKKHNSIKEAAQSVGATPIEISKCCNLNVDRVADCYWEFENENDAYGGPNV